MCANRAHDENSSADTHTTAAGIDAQHVRKLANRASVDRALAESPNPDI